MAGGERGELDTSGFLAYDTDYFRVVLGLYGDNGNFLNGNYYLGFRDGRLSTL